MDNLIPEEKINLDMEKLKPTTPAHCDVFNERFEQLLSNDKYLDKKEKENINSDEGVHNLRYYNGFFQIKIDEKWVNVGKSFITADEAPEDTNMLWIDTSIGGVTKYHNGKSWVPTKAVWG